VHLLACYLNKPQNARCNGKERNQNSRPCHLLILITQYFSGFQSEKHGQTWTTSIDGHVLQTLRLSSLKWISQYCHKNYHACRQITGLWVSLKCTHFWGPWLYPHEFCIFTNINSWHILETNDWWVAKVRRLLRGGRRLLSCVASRLEWVFVDFTHLCYRHTNSFQKPTLLYASLHHNFPPTVIKHLPHLTL